MVVLNFCPSCGNKLPQESVIRFCPHCGQNVSALTEIQPELPAIPAAQPEQTPAQLEVKSYADVIRYYDRFVAELKQQQLEPAEIRQQAAAFFATLKEQLPARSAAAKKKLVLSQNKKTAEKDAFYSIILKSCHDKERLTRRLSEVLCRGLTATRMAVELVPCIIIYKNRDYEIEAATTIFSEENAHYTLITGEFATDMPAEIIFPGFKDYDAELQAILRNTPATLWLGETIQLIIPEMEMEEEPSALIATDWGIYIFNRLMQSRRPEWIEIPYTGLAEVVIHKEQNELELVYKEYGREEWLHIADGSCLNALHEQITKALL